MSEVNSETHTSTVSIPNINVFIEKLGQEKDIESPTTPSRKEVRDKAQNSITEDDREIIFECALNVGVDFDPENYTQDDVDRLAKELKVLRRTQDILNGRHDAIRGLVFATIDSGLDEENPEQHPGELVSTVESYKMVRSIRGGKVVPNWNLLKDYVTEDVWNFIIDKVHTVITKYDNQDKVVEESSHWEEVVNEGRLKEAIESNFISIDILRKAVSKSKITQAFSPSDM